MKTIQSLVIILLVSLTTCRFLQFSESPSDLLSFNQKEKFTSKHHKHYRQETPQQIKENIQQKQKKEQSEIDLSEFQLEEIAISVLAYSSVFLLILIIRKCCVMKRNNRPNNYLKNYQQKLILQNYRQRVHNTSDVQMQIKYHQNQIQKLSQEKERIQQQERRKMEEIEYNAENGFKYRNKIPVGKPIREKRDNDSSFASEYPNF